MSSDYDDNKWWIYKVWEGIWWVSGPNDALSGSYASWREAMDYVIQEAGL